MPGLYFTSFTMTVGRARRTLERALCEVRSSLWNENRTLLLSLLNQFGTQINQNWMLVTKATQELSISSKPVE
jgi:hypothetical protein